MQFGVGTALEILIQEESHADGKDEHFYYVYMVSFALSRYHIGITSGLVLNVIC